MSNPDQSVLPSVVFDFSITVLLWIYFTLGFVVFFAPWYIITGLFSARSTQYFQTLNHYFLRGFFGVCRLLIPRHHWHIDAAIPSIRSSVIVCNHISYIDSIFLVSLFKKHTTIVKSSLFHLPIMGTLLKRSGYVPSESAGPLADIMVHRMDTLCETLATGSNLIVFPEGTRSRTGAIGPFNPGAFKLARLCRAPMQVLFIRNSEKLFKPGRFLFNTRCFNTISLQPLAEIKPDYEQDNFSHTELMDEVRGMMMAQKDGGEFHP
jgi:1-acyl-sn-glycerol-3-phosphate acyltransferase